MRIGFARAQSGGLEPLADPPDVTLSRRPWLKAIALRGEASFLGAKQGEESRFELSPDLTCVIGRQHDGQEHPARRPPRPRRGAAAPGRLAPQAGGGAWPRTPARRRRARGPRVPRRGLDRDRSRALAGGLLRAERAPAAGTRIWRRRRNPRAARARTDSVDRGAPPPLAGARWRTLPASEATRRPRRASGRRRAGLRAREARQGGALRVRRGGSRTSPTKRAARAVLGGTRCRLAPGCGASSTG